MTKLPLYLALTLLPCLHAAAGGITLRTEMEADAAMKWAAGGGSGICPEVLRAISRKDPGIEFAWGADPVPQKRVVAEAEAGRIDVVCGLGRTPRLKPPRAERKRSGRRPWRFPQLPGKASKPGPRRS